MMRLRCLIESVRIGSFLSIFLTKDESLDFLGSAHMFKASDLSFPLRRRMHCQ